MALDPGTVLALKKFAGSALAKTVLTSVGKALAEFQERKGERAVAALVAALAELDGLPPEEAAAALDKLLTTVEPGAPAPHDTLYEAFRSFAFTRSEAAWPYIARLTAGYLVQSRGIDSFFRRAAWLLERCEEQDVEVLRLLSVRTRDELRTREVMSPSAVRWIFEEGGGVTMRIHAPKVAPKVIRLDGGRSGRETAALVQESRLTRGGGENELHFPLRDGHLRRLVELFGNR